MEENMDELEKAAIESAAKALLAPVTKTVGDLIGVLGGDQLEEYRAAKRERRRIAKDETVTVARQLVIRRGVTPDVDTPPERLEEILEAAQDNSIPELRDLFARLAAAAVDPARQGGYRREYVDVVKRLEPFDAALLQNMIEKSIYGDSWVQKASVATGKNEDEVIVAGINLENMGLLQRSAHVQHIASGAHTSSKARQFWKCVSG
jgi:hypothetical protein